MTASVPNQLVYSYSGDGSTQIFSYPVRFLDDAELVVVLEASDGTQTVKTLTTHYTVSGAGEANGGSVTMLTAPAAGETLYIYRSTAATQSVDLTDNNRSPAATVEEQLDRFAMGLQDIKEASRRTYRTPAGETDKTIEIVAEGHFLKADASGNLVDGGSATDISEAQTNAAAAAASASAAASSATAAASSASAAASSAADASTSATEAAASAASIDPASIVHKADTDASTFGFIVDEDDMASDSAVKLPTQQSVKAYVDAGKLAENLSYSPLFNLTRVRSVQERLSEGVYLDDFLGATDTDKFLDFAANSDERFIRIPGRVVNIDATIEGTDKYWHIKGAGTGASTIQYNGTADDTTPVFKVIRDGSDIKSFYQVSDLKFNVENPYSGIPIWVEEQRPVGADQVVGGIDLLYIDNVICDAEGDGYWARFLHAENAGGISVKRFQARNNGSATAQADTRTKGLYFNNSQSNIFCIRTLEMSQFNLGRVYNAIELNITNSIESLYLSEFEIVGAHDGILAYGAGKLGATRLGGGHMDILRSGIFANPSGGMNFVRLNGTDIRRSNNGGDYEAGDCVHLAGNSRYLAVTGCTFTGNRSVNPAMAQSGILFSGQAAGAIAGNTYIDLQYGNQFGNAVSDIQVGVNSYYEVEQDNIVSSTSSDTINIVPRYRGKRALVTRTTDQSIANNTASAIGWNSQVLDDVGLFTLASNSIFTIPANVSRVKLRASVWMAAAASGALTLQILKNGAPVLGGAYRQIDLADASNDAIAIETAGIACVAGDTFSVQITQTSGGALALKGTGNEGLHSWFEIEVLA